MNKKLIQKIQEYKSFENFNFLEAFFSEKYSFNELNSDKVFTLPTKNTFYGYILNFYLIEKDVESLKKINSFVNKLFQIEQELSEFGKVYVNYSNYNNENKMSFHVRMWLITPEKCTFSFNKKEFHDFLHNHLASKSYIKDDNFFRDTKILIKLKDVFDDDVLSLVEFNKLKKDLLETLKNFPYFFNFEFKSVEKTDHSKYDKALNEYKKHTEYYLILQIYFNYNPQDDPTNSIV